MLVAGAAVAVGLGCLYYGARALRVRRAVRRLRGRDGRGRPGHRTDWAGAGDGSIDSGATVAERGSLERGVVLLALGAVCLLFGVLAV